MGSEEAVAKAGGGGALQAGKGSPGAGRALQRLPGLRPGDHPFHHSGQGWGVESRPRELSAAGGGNTSQLMRGSGC